MSKTRRKVEVGRHYYDSRFVAVTTLDTGVKMHAESEWKPSHWDQNTQKAEAERQLRFDLRTAQGLGLGHGPIAIYKERRETKTETVETITAEFYAEVAP